DACPAGTPNPSSCVTPNPITKTCTASLTANEPDTATVNCFCTPEKDVRFTTTASDTASFQCPAICGDNMVNAAGETCDGTDLDHAPPALPTDPGSRRVPREGEGLGRERIRRHGVVRGERRRGNATAGEESARHRLERGGGRLRPPPRRRQRLPGAHQALEHG